MTTGASAPSHDDSNEQFADAELDERYYVRRGQNRRRVLLAAGLLVTTGLVLQFVGPCLGPTRIVEGPMVQQADATSARVIFYTTREAPVQFTYQIDGQSPKTATVETSGMRHCAVLENLSPATAYLYEIKSAGRPLASASLRTAKTLEQPYRFVVFGDSGRATQAQYRLGGVMADARPDFVVHTGDVVYPAGARNAYRDRFFQPYRRMLAEVPFWPSLGNHDDSKETRGDPYREIFELPQNGPPGETPENHYWFDYANARFVVIDSNVSESVLAERVAPWLRETLAASSATWKFVVFHHPPYAFGKNESDLRIQRAIVPACEAAGVDIVFNGHDHLYQRSLPLRSEQPVDVSRGVVYIISGAGGASLYREKEPSKRPAYIAALRDDAYSFTTVEITGRSLSLKQTAVDGTVMDQWSRSK